MGKQMRQSSDIDGDAQTLIDHEDGPQTQSVIGIEDLVRVMGLLGGGKKTYDDKAGLGPSVRQAVLRGEIGKVVLEIHASKEKGEPQIIPVINGDYEARVKRGVKVIASMATVTALTDSVTGVYDEKTGETTDVPSYPFSYRPYAGELPIGTTVRDMEGRPMPEKRPA